MSRNYKFWDQDKAYFVTYATVYWIDALTRQAYKNILVESLQYCIKNKGLIVYGWCIMSNHVHLIIGTRQEKMQHIIRDMKKFTSKEIIRTIKDNPQESRKEWMLALFSRAGRKNSNNKEYQFWQQHNQPIELDYAEIIQQKLDYIHNNPVKAGFVIKPWQYIC
jgi:REP element-mobilizing transposase RayT